MQRLRVERPGPDAAERVRAVRLRALEDAPDAFGTTLAEDRARPMASWRERLARSDGATFLAVVDGEDVGMAVGAPYEAGAAGLFGMWVAAEHRGRRVSDALVEAVLAWARAAGHARLLLDVGDENLPALRCYERLGFLPTGVTGHLPPPRDHVREHQRVRVL